MAWGQIAFWTPSNEHTALQLSLYVHFDEHPRYSPKVCEKLQPLFDTYYKTMVWHTEPTLRISYLSGAFFAISKTHLGQAIGPEGIENKWPERSLYRYLFWLHAFCFPLESHLEKIRSGPETKGNKTFKSLNLGACLIPMYSWNAFLVLPKTQTRHCAMVWCQMRSEPNQKRIQFCSYLYRCILASIQGIVRRFAKNWSLYLIPTIKPWYDIQNPLWGSPSCQARFSPSQKRI